MSSILEQFLLLPVTPPGNLAYHAILAFTIFGALASTLNSYQTASPSTRRRMTVGLVVILCLQLALFIITGLVWQGLIGTGNIIPVFDRFIALLSLLIIIWLWTYPATSRPADFIAVFLGLLLVALGGYALVWWQAQQPIDMPLTFNGSVLDLISNWLALGLILLGVFILIIRRPQGWGFGLAMLSGLAVGYWWHRFSLQINYDFAGAVRLAEMAFYPLLLALPQRLPAYHAQIAPAITAEDQDRPTFNQDVRAQGALIKLCMASSPKQFYQDLASTIAHLMTADICLLVLPQLNERFLIFPGGYNLITDSQIEGFSLEQRKVPTLAKTLDGNKSMHLPVGSSETELMNLASALKVDQIGALLAAPITDRDEHLLGILLLTPYSKHSWSKTDQRYLDDATQALAPVIQRLQQEIKVHEQLEQIRLRMEALDSDATQAVSENAQLISRLETVQNELANEKQRSSSLAALVSEHTTQQGASLPEQSDLILDGQLRQEVAPEYEQMQSDLRLVLEELASLRQSLAQADKTILELQTQAARASSHPGSSDREVIVSIAQELRQPMSSIIGYTDLLLGESVGLLGAMQRKFLERVKASSERMGGLLEELIQVTAIDGGEVSLNPVMVDLNAVIDESVSNMITQLSEKNITLRVDLPDELPPIQADLEALQQILSNLLSNAILATSADGGITLRARVEVKENEPSFLLLQVSDQGGGIPAADLPRVFSRLYRADNVLIQGIGDTGVGLAIVKTLVEAHHGRVWVDTEMEHGSTFSVLLPLSETSVNEIPGETAG